MCSTWSPTALKASATCRRKVGDLRMFADAVRRGRRERVGARPRRGRAAGGPQTETSPLDNLTPRERQVLAQMAEGRSKVGIARELTVTVAAVERHVTSTFDKLGLHQSPDQHRRVLAVLTYLRA